MTRQGGATTIHPPYILNIQKDVRWELCSYRRMYSAKYSKHEKLIQFFKSKMN